jgi:hypothetical protein
MVDGDGALRTAIKLLLPNNLRGLSRVPNEAPCLRMLSWSYHRGEKAKGTPGQAMSARGAWDRSHVRPQRGLTMGGNVYSEQARLREAQEVQYERGRNRLASETFLARLRAEHGPEPRFDLRPSCKDKR